jgi:hypothetical protein
MESGVWRESRPPPQLLAVLIEQRRRRDQCNAQEGQQGSSPARPHHLIQPWRSQRQTCRCCTPHNRVGRQRTRRCRDVNMYDERYAVGEDQHDSNPPNATETTCTDQCTCDVHASQNNPFGIKILPSMIGGRRSSGTLCLALADGFDSSCWSTKRGRRRRRGYRRAY